MYLTIFTFKLPLDSGYIGTMSYMHNSLSKQLNALWTSPNSNNWTLDTSLTYVSPKYVNIYPRLDLCVKNTQTHAFTHSSDLGKIRNHQNSRKSILTLTDVKKTPRSDYEILQLHNKKKGTWRETWFFSSIYKNLEDGMWEASLKSFCWE